MVVSIQELIKNPQLSCNIYTSSYLPGNAFERVLCQDDQPRHEREASDQVPELAVEEAEVRRAVQTLEQPGQLWAEIQVGASLRPERWAG